MRVNIIADYDYSSLQVALASVCKGFFHSQAFAGL